MENKKAYYETPESNNASADPANIKPEPDTLHKTDPQDNMEGPASSIAQDLGELFDSEEDAKNSDK